MNQRNNIYVKEFNPDRGIRLANNKEQTKKFLSQRSIPVPKTFFHIKNRQDWFQFNAETLLAKTFVIKPNKGSKGQGIFVINDCRKREIEWKVSSSFFKKINNLANIYEQQIKDFWYEFSIGGKWISEIDLKKKAGWIFQWLFSSLGKPDTMLIEEKLIPWPWFELFCKYGLADMRIIMFNLVPVIAMLRVPTKASWGKANLAQGGIGLGIDIVTGKVNSLYWQGQSYTTNFPEERSQFKNKKIPYRQEILEYSANAQYFVNSWYLGMDWVITNKWPKLLEINARAWLEIQNITGKPLLNIMKKIEDLNVTTPSKGLEISRSLFGTDRTTDIKPKNVIYLSQAGKLLYIRDNKRRWLPITLNVWLDKIRNYASEKVIKRILGAKNITIDLWTATHNIENTKLYLDTDIKWNKIILWQEALKDFYIIPSYKSKVLIKILNKEFFDNEEMVSLTLLDEKINLINKKLNLSKFLKPINYLDEFDQFVAYSGKYNPQFIYKFPTFKELRMIEEEVKQIDIKYRQKEYFDSEFSEIFFEKLDELQYKINLLRSYKRQDLKNIQYYNILLFGNLNKELIEVSKTKMEDGRPKYNMPTSPILTWSQIFERFEQYILEHKMNNVRVRSDTSTLSWITVGFGKSAVIKIKTNMRMREYKVIGKIAHEVDVHVIRYLAGKETGRNIFKTWTAWYITTEEWLAVYRAEKKLQEMDPNYENFAQYESYDRLYKSTSLNFEEMVSYILQTQTIKNYPYKALFNAILKTKKWLKDTSIKNTGIIFWKNATYLNWYTQIKDLDKETIEKLYRGKIKISDLKYFK